MGIRNPFIFCSSHWNKFTLTVLKFYFRFLSICLILSIYSLQVGAQIRFEPANPEEYGFSEPELEALSLYLEEKGSSSMVIIKNGVLVYQWGEIHQKYTIHSIRKSMLNALYGIYVEEGVIDTNQTLQELKIDDLFGLSALEKSARIADLLKSRSGVYHPAAAVSPEMLYGKPDRNSKEPGTHYYYNNWDFNVLGAIIEQKTGSTIYELFQSRIAEPLGMEDYEGSYTSFDVDDKSGSKEPGIPETDGFYQFESSKSKYPAYHFRLSTRDMALFGQLYLQNGRWNEKQILPESWIKASTTVYSLYNPRHQIGYGLLWSVIQTDSDNERNSFFHTGTGVHMMGVYPQSDMVFVHRVDTETGSAFRSDDLYGVISRVFSAKTEE